MKTNSKRDKDWWWIIGYTLTYIVILGALASASMWVLANWINVMFWVDDVLQWFCGK